MRIFCDLICLLNILSTSWEIINNFTSCFYVQLLLFSYVILVYKNFSIYSFYSYYYYSSHFLTSSINSFRFILKFPIICIYFSVYTCVLVFLAFLPPPLTLYFFLLYLNQTFETGKTVIKSRIPHKS